MKYPEWQNEVAKKKKKKDTKPIELKFPGNLEGKCLEQCFILYLYFALTNLLSFVIYAKSKSQVK